MYYTYEIRFDDGCYYYGRRKCPDGMTPDEDQYSGSPVTNKEHWDTNEYQKIIIETGLTKRQAEVKEDTLIGDLYKTDPMCLNASPANKYSNADSSWYNNGVDSKMFFDDKVPEGYVPGRLGTAAKGKKYYTDGKVSRMFFEGEQPVGWELGNITSQNKTKNPFFTKTHNVGKTAYHKGNQVGWFFEGEQPVGWERGHTDRFKKKRSKKYTGSGNPNYGKSGRKFFNNGQITKLYVPGEEPEGWQQGLIRKKSNE